MGFELVVGDDSDFGFAAASGVEVEVDATGGVGAEGEAVAEAF